MCWVGRVAGVTRDSPGLAKHDSLSCRSAEEAEMYQYYLEVGICLRATMADGSCGIDMCTMILGWERCPHNWEKVRQMLHEFAFKHMDNRAVVYLKSSGAEIQDHLRRLE